MAMDMYLSIQEIVYALGIFQSKILQKHSGEGLTLNEVKILEIIGNSRTKKMMKDIAQLMGMTKGGMTFLVDKLEKKNLVRRNPSEFDRRVIYIELTNEGKKVNDKLSGFKYGFVSELFEGMDDSTREVFRSELSKAVERAVKMSV